MAKAFPGRSGKQCRERWHNHVDERVKKGEWTAEVTLVTRSRVLNTPSGGDDGGEAVVSSYVFYIVFSSGLLLAIPKVDAGGVFVF